jgi:hypothetical protein
MKKSKTDLSKSKNTVKTGTAEPKPKGKGIKLPKIRLNFGLLRSLSTVMDGSILTSSMVSKSAPFFVFLFIIAMIYIGNNFVSQSKVKEIDGITRELKDLRDEHISTKSDLMYFTKRSELAKRLNFKGIEEATEPPQKIYVLKKDRN